MSEFVAAPGDLVGMGEIRRLSPGEKASSILGSCVGVALWCKERQTGMFAHVVLPGSGGKKGPPGRFADSAIASMINELEIEGIVRRDLVAKIAGGAQMFGKTATMVVGIENVETVTALLAAHKIPIEAKDVGGTVGRKATFFADNGTLLIHTAGKPDLEI